MTNEKQAWKYLAKKWKDATKCYSGVSPVVYIGNSYATAICRCVRVLYQMSLISGTTCLTMEEKLRRYGKKHNFDNDSFFWENDKEGAKARYKFCLNRSRSRKKKG